MEPIDTANTFEFERGKRVAGFPAWWRTFIFQILNGRQLSVYLYLLALMGDDNACAPTTKQIAEDLGLLSSTMVFDSIGVLEEFGLILRWRKTAAVAGSRRNVYQRPACEYTILQLVKKWHLDGATDGSAEKTRYVPRPLPIAMDVFDGGMRALLGERYARYAATASPEKWHVLALLLSEKLALRYEEPLAFAHVPHDGVERAVHRALEAG